MTCPLCAHNAGCPSWLGSTFYRGKEFRYAECRSCRSLYCDPMPDGETIAQMYGPDYEKSFGVDPAVADPKEPLRALDWLERLGKGTFIDYGCGAGALLVEAARLNWHPIGVEFDPEVACQVQVRTGATVVSDPSVLLNGEGPPADALHLGDVIEHLTSLDEQMPGILRLLKPGGTLLAQGPLEGGPNLFTLGLRAGKSLARSKRAEMAPYHVLLASVKGQHAFFRRFGLEQMEYTIREVAWPAPSRLSVSDLKRPRAVALYTLRRMSQGLSTLRPDSWGNRYFYAGRWNG